MKNIVKEISNISVNAGIKTNISKKIQATQLKKVILRQINHGLTMNAEKNEVTLYNLRGDC